MSAILKPVIFVAGLARCGTSLTMQMLHAAGIPCAGEWPAFEPEEIGFKNEAISPAWLRAHSGCAMKWLNPHMLAADPSVPSVVIWLDRCKREQAKSQMKMACMLMGLPPVNRSQLRRVDTMLERDRALAMKAIGDRPMLVSTFEKLVRFPYDAASEIAAFLGSWFDHLDPKRMADCVIPRGLLCQPGLDIELQLIASAEAGIRHHRAMAI